MLENSSADCSNTLKSGWLMPALLWYHAEQQNNDRGKERHGAGRECQTKKNSQEFAGTRSDFEHVAKT
eukprot:768571-Hanusia_phi.AAC.11